MASSASFGEVLIRFGSDTSGFSKGIDAMKRQARGFESDMSQTTGKVSGGFGGMLKSALAFAGGQAIFTAVGASVGFLKDQLGGCLQESMDAQAGLALTTAVLKSTGDASGMTASAIVDLAGSLSHLTKFSDDTVQAAENMLLTFTNIGKSVFPDATKSVLDMSQALGQDTKSSAIQLGKALNDPIAGVSALQRVGVTFTQKQKDLIKSLMDTNNVAGAQGVILKEIQKEFGGAAVAAGKTFGGQMIIAQQRLADVKQTIGDALLPILTNLMTAINARVMPAVERFGGFVATTVVPALARWGQVIATNVFPLLQQIGGVIAGVVTFLGHLSESTRITSTNFLSWGGALFFTQGSMSQIASIMNGTFAPALDAIKAKLGPLLGAIGNVGNALGGALAAALRAVSIALGGININPLAQGLGTLAGQGMQIAINGLNNLAAGIRTLTPTIVALSPVLSGIVTNFQLVAGVIQTNFVPAMQNVGKFMDAYVYPALQRIGAFLVTTFKPVWDQLVTTIQTQLIPVWNDLVKSIQPVLPQLQQFGQFLLGVLGVAITLIIGIIGGLIGALAGALTGIIKIFGGIVEVISGAIKIVSGIIAVFIDLATGNFGKLGTDLGLIFNGIGTMFHGFWEIIKGVFETGTNIIVGFCTGFWHTIVGIVQTLSNDLVGHSIIPDMINAIIGYFTFLWTRGREIFTQMGSTLKGVWDAISNTARTTWNTIVSNVSGAMTNLWNTVSSRAGQIRDTFLGAFGQIRDGIGLIVRVLGNNAIKQLNGMLDGLRTFLKFFADAINNVANAVGAGHPIGAVTIGSVPYLAAGTENFAGGPAIVGERGRELVMLPRGTSVLPHEETEQVLRGKTPGHAIPGFAAGVGDLLSWFTQGGVGSVLSHIFDAKLTFTGAMSKIADGLMKMIETWGLDKIGTLLTTYLTQMTQLSGMAGGDFGLPGVNLGQFILPAVNAMFHAKMSYGTHQGIDLNYGQGTPLRELIGGTVLANTGFKAWGGELDVQLPTGMWERYLHLSRIDASAGEHLVRGQGIGLSGGGTPQSGLGMWSSGAHLHVQYDGGNINAGLDPLGVWASYGLTQPFNFNTALGQTAGHASAGETSGGLAGWITQAIGLTGVPPSWLSSLETIAMKESGGNPSAVNRSDSNAAAGHPSQGLMQTIASTFAAYAVAGHGNILNPVDNAAAAIRYIQARYGSVFNVPGIAAMASGRPYVGYANGGLISEEIRGVGASGQRYLFGENGPERVTPARAGGAQDSVIVNLNVDGRTLAQAMGPFLSNELRINLGVAR